MPPSPTPSVQAPINVLIVDDSAFMRAALSRLIGSDPMLKVVAVARDGREGVEKAKALNPDVITLDIEMPGVDGLTALRTIRRECKPCPAVLMCSSLTTEGSHAALQALRLGAADVIAKESSNVSSQMDAMRDDLIGKIKAIASQRAVVAGLAAKNAPGAAPMPAPVPLRIKPGHTFRPDEFDLIAIGSSTGGPPVLETILTSLPAGMRAPIVVAQHMPVLFTKSLASRLDELCSITVVHAEAGMPLHAGTAYICPGGLHTRIVRTPAGRMTLEMSEEPKTELYRPSVNVLFSSASRVATGKVLGVVLTGMGEDGVVGARELRVRPSGTTLLAQEASTCVVYGMPKAIVQGGLADGVGNAEELAAMIASCSLPTAAKAA